MLYPGFILSVELYVALAALTPRQELCNDLCDFILGLLTSDYSDQ